MCAAGGVKSITRQKDEGNGQKPQNLKCIERVFAEHFKHVGEQTDAGTKQNQSGHIERIGVLFAIIRQVKVDQAQTREANRYVYEEDQSPVKVPDDQSAGDRP